MFGAIPIVKHAAPRIATLLSTAGRGYSACRERHRARNALVIVQVALALVLLLVGVGVALGFSGAAGAHPANGMLLFGVDALDPVTYAAVAAVLIATAALAGWLPARRVTRVDPMRALREE